MSTTYIPAALFRIAVKDGKAGAVTALKPSRRSTMRMRCGHPATACC